MHLNTLDWMIVVVTLLVTFSPVLFLARRGGRGTSEFFLSGRAAPWWLIGTSMVATTFSTDTPNLVTDFVRTGGVAKNWSWWAFLLTGMTTVFFYARLWRRSGVLTDLEFYEMRYSGYPAAFLRGFRSIYLGLVFNVLIMATVTLAATKIGGIMLGWDRVTTIVVCGVICIVFGSIAGLWGVLASDLLQFAVAMVGVVLAAYFAVNHADVGGLSGLLQKVDPKTLSILPDFGDPAAVLSLLLIPLAVQWWSVWYPGAEPGGGSYVAQRMLAARSERDALAGTLWFNLAHYAIRPWPWILVALASIVVFPSVEDIRERFPNVDPSLIGEDIAYPAMLTLLPHGVLGLLVASLLAAYVSTMTTHMNWGASYLVSDFYSRFASGRRQGDPIDPAEERRLVWIGRAVSALLVVLSGGLAYMLTTAGEAFEYLLAIGAGTGLLYLLRWYWSRINAWSEISAMAAAGLATGWFIVQRKLGHEVAAHHALLLSVGFTTLVWVTVTLLTPRVDSRVLTEFYRRVRPAGPGWTAVRSAAGLPPSTDNLGQSLLGTILGCAVVYSALFGVGFVLYGQTAAAGVCAVVLALAGFGLARVLRREWRDAPRGG